jgi:hypothetical protein
VISKKQAKILFLIFVTKRPANFLKTISADIKSTDLFLRTPYKYFSRDTVPFNKINLIVD